MEVGTEHLDFESSPINLETLDYTSSGTRAVELLVNLTDAVPRLKS